MTDKSQRASTSQRTPDAGIAEFMLRPVSLRRPELLDPLSAWLGHIPFAFWLVEALRPRIMVELGVYTGASYCAFCEAVRDLEADGRCYGVDHWQGDAHAGSYGNQIFDRLDAFHRPRFSTFSTLVKSDFDAAAGQMADGSIDLLHIDGLHTYEAVRHDFETWLPKLSARAVVLFHDTRVKTGDFGVYRFWSEVAERYPHFEFSHSYGLGVLAVGSDQTPAVEWLTRARAPADATAAAISDFFSRLGLTLVTEDESVHQLGLATKHSREAAALIASYQKQDRFSVRRVVRLLRRLSARLRHPDINSPA